MGQIKFMKKKLLKNKIFLSLIFSSLLIGWILVFSFFDFSLDFNFKNFLAQIEAFAQETSLELMPRYPLRIIYLADELMLTMEDLSFLTEDLKDELKKCDCKNAQSLCGNFNYKGCGSSIVVGDPCPNRREIEEKKEELEGEIRELVFLRNLLETEMKSGLMKEIETLPPDFVQDMKDNLKLILDDTEKTVEKAEKVYDFSQKSPLDACVALCLPGEFPEFDLCAERSQDSIKLKLKLSVGLEDLDLGQVSIGKINLPLPEEIEIGRMGKLTPFKIKGTEFSFSLDNPLDVIQLQPTRLPLPEEKPYLRFSCPEFPKPEPSPEPSDIWTVCKKAGWCEDHKEICENNPEALGDLASLCEGCKTGVFVRGRGQTLHKLPKVDSCTGVVEPSSPNSNLACNAFCIHTADTLHTRGNPRTFTKEEMLPYKKLFDHFGFEVPEKCYCDKNLPDQTGKYNYGVACGIWITDPPPPELKCQDLKGCSDCVNVPINLYGEEENSLVDIDWYFNIFEKLSDMCLEMPDNSDTVGGQKIPTTSGKDCLDPEKVVEKILKDCEPKDVYACKKAKYCQSHQDPGCNPIGFNRGLGSAFSDPEKGEVDRCTGPHVKETDSLAFKMCRFFCVQFADTLYQRGETRTFSHEELVKHGKRMFDYLFPGKPIPAECVCNKDWEVAKKTRFTTGCSQCVPIAQTVYEGVPCNYLTDEGKSKACREFFQAIGESVPTGCSSDPVETMKSKCQELKELKKEGEAIPNEDKVYFYCALVAIYEGKLEMPGGVESGGEAPIFERDINDYPSTIPGCSASFPTIPKLCLPSLKIPDLSLPELKLDGFVKIKPPSLIIEDLNLPCWELCDLDACDNLFPPFDFGIPYFSLPAIEIPPISLGTIRGVSLPDLQIPPISFPSVPYPIFRAPNFQNLIVPELHYSGAKIPLPTFGFSLEGIDFGPIFNYIVTFILNALEAPEGCISVRVPSPPIPIEITFPDYYFGWSKIPDLPEIPFCKDINTFCSNIKEKLNKIPEISEKFREIEEFFNEFVQKEIQSKLDEIASKVQQIIQEEIQQRLEEIRKDVRRQVEQQIAEGKRMIEVTIEDIDLPPIDLDKLTGFPLKIPIPWPEELKEIVLRCDQASYNQCMDNVYQQCEKKCKQQYEDKCSLPYLECVTLCQMERGFEECAKTYLECLGYPLPRIPLSCLSYEKEFPIKGPGMQKTTFTFKASGTQCIEKKPIGGNPYPIDQIQSAIQEIKNYQTKIDGASQKIIDILQ